MPVSLLSHAVACVTLSFCSTALCAPRADACCARTVPEQEKVIGLKYGQWGREKYGTTAASVDALEVGAA